MAETDPESADHWQQVAALYDEAVALEPGERGRFMTRTCGTDTALRTELESLFAQDARRGPLDRPVWVADDLLVDPAVLPAGTMVGPYRVEGVLGEGGMGQVYRATDTKLGRQVALKVLPEHFACDADRRARFLREARVLAVLNHPGIGAIYGVDDSSQVPALVLELVEGPTLADRLAAGPMAVSEALSVAASIIDALETAHDAGIVHRDLKPANIKVRSDGTVKVLDFGLARLLHADYTPAWREASGADTSPAEITIAGSILGTAAYMSPEQAKGHPADVRSDVWAFGCVLYEMLSGRRAFAGDDVAGTLAAVLRDEPDWSALPLDTPPTAHRVLRRCLQKDRKRRVAAIADVRLDLQEPSAPASPSSSRLSWWAAAAALLAAFAAWIGPWTSRATPGATDTTMRFTVAPPQDLTFGGPLAGGTGNSAQLAISPDGQHIAFVAGTPAGYRLYVRPLTSLTARALPGTDGATYPFWAPDSHALGFFADGKVKRIALNDGVPIVLADAPQGRGGTWSKEGVVVFAPLPLGGLKQVPSEGGPATDVAFMPPRDANTDYRWPFFLPDGRHFLFTVTAGACCPPMRPAVIRVGSLDPAEATRDVVEAESSAIYSDGRLVFARDAILLAQPFDVVALRLTGDAVPIGERVSWEGSRYVSASLSVTGTLVFATGAVPTIQQVTWFSRAGNEVGNLGDPKQYHTLALSPDGRHAAIALQTASQSNVDLWLFDVMSGSSSRLSDEAGLEGSPVWSPDGRRLAYQRERDGASTIHVMTLEGRIDETLLDATADGDSDVPTSWSADGRFLVFTRRDAAGHSGIWALPMTGERTAFRVTQDDALTTSGQISPDGRWLAFTRLEHGRSEVFVQPFPRGGVRHPVSRGETAYPLWRADGRELFVLTVGADRDGFVTAIPIRLGAQVETGAPLVLFRAGAPRFSDGQIYAASRDGSRFLVNARPQRPSLEPLTVVVNWPALLKPPR